MKWFKFLCLFSCLMLIEVMLSAKSESQNFLRKIKNLPQGYKLWYLDSYKEKVFAIIMGEVDARRMEPVLPLPLPHQAMQIDIKMERATKPFATKHISAIALSAMHDPRPDAWMAKDYDFWILNRKGETAYALKPICWDEFDYSKRYSKIYVLDVRSRQVKATIRISLGGRRTWIGGFALHPYKNKFYVGVTESEEGSLLRVYDTQTMKLIKVLYLKTDISPRDFHFSQDGRWLWVSIGARGIAIIETSNDELMGWISPPEDRDFTSRIAVSKDEREIYVGITFALRKGAVGAIDLSKRKLIRVLELSPTGCTSVVVVGDKLFAACLDGVYVIDIPEWRKQNDK